MKLFNDDIFACVFATFYSEEVDTGQRASNDEKSFRIQLALHIQYEYHKTQCDVCFYMPFISEFIWNILFLHNRPQSLRLLRVFFYMFLKSVMLVWDFKHNYSSL